MCASHDRDVNRNLVHEEGSYLIGHLVFFQYSVQCVVVKEQTNLEAF